MPLNAPIDGPPPSPETDGAAAQEAGRPASQVAQLTAGRATGPMMGAGPDLSGIMALGMKVDEALATLAQAVPLIAGEIDQMRAMLVNALGKFSAAGGSSGTSPSAPLVPPGGAPSGPAPAPIAAAGAGFPGGMSGNSRPF